MARPKDPRFRATTEREVYAFLVGADVELVPGADPDWPVWVPSGVPREQAVSSIAIDEGWIFDPGFHPEDALHIDDAPSVLRDLGTGRRVVSTKPARPRFIGPLMLAKPVAKKTVEVPPPVPQPPPQKLTVADLNRYRRGILVMAEPSHAWAEACREVGVLHGSGDTTSAPWWSPLADRRRLDAESRVGPDANPPLRGRNSDAATKLTEWVRAFGLLDSRLPAYGVPAQNIMAALAAVAEVQLEFPDKLGEFFMDPDAAERAWEYRLANYYGRTRETAPRNPARKALPISRTEPPR